MLKSNSKIEEEFTSAEEQKIRLYFDNFVTFYAGLYAIKWNNRQRGWKTKRKSFSDHLIIAHLQQTYSVAAVAAYYPRYYYLDFDFGADEHGGSGHPRVLKAISRLNLSDNQYRLMSSPRYFESGNCHLIIKLEDGRAPVPVRRGNRLLQAIVGDLCEVYPQPNKVFRLPLGFGQHIFEEDLLLINLSWQSAFNFLLKIEPVEIKRLLPPNSDDALAAGKNNHIAFSQNVEDAGLRHFRYWEICRELLDEGLKAYGTRFESQWLLACYYQRKQVSANEAFEKIIGWLKHKHNGYSAAVSGGQWKTIYAELKRQLRSAYKIGRAARIEASSLMPQANSVITGSDFFWIASVFPKDIVRQKKLHRLVRYCRANHRWRYEWIYIPHYEWYKIAGTHTYKTFIFELDSLGIIEPCWEYRHLEKCPEGSFPRKFKMHLPAPGGSGKMFQETEPDYIDALMAQFGSKVSKLAMLTGIPRQRFYDYLKS